MSCYNFQEKINLVLSCLEHKHWTVNKSKIDVLICGCAGARVDLAANVLAVIGRHTFLVTAFKL